MRSAFSITFGEKTLTRNAFNIGNSTQMYASFIQGMQNMIGFDCTSYTTIKGRSHHTSSIILAATKSQRHTHMCCVNLAGCPTNVLGPRA